MHAQSGMLGERDQQVVVIMGFQVHLDREVRGYRADDAVDGRRSGRVADQQDSRRRCRGDRSDQQVPGRRLVGHAESGRPQGHHRYGVAGSGGACPRRCRPGGVVQHNLDREMTGAHLSPGDGVGPLEFGIGAVRVGEPESQPRGRFGHRVLEQRRRHHRDPNEIRCQIVGFDDGGGVVTGTEPAHDDTGEPACHQRGTRKGARVPSFSQVSSNSRSGLELPMMPAPARSQVCPSRS